MSDSINYVIDKKKISSSIPSAEYLEFEESITKTETIIAGESATICEMLPVAPDYYLYNKSNLDIICDHIDSIKGDTMDKNKLIKHLKLDDVKEDN